MTAAAMIPHAPAATGRSVVSDKHCVFRLGTACYSLLATSVREVTMRPEVVRVPGSHALLAGLCHLRNEFVPVVNLEPLVGGVAKRGKAASKMIVLGGTAGNWALLVDEVISLESLETLNHSDARSSESGVNAVMGTATFRDQVVRVLDPNSLYRRAEELLRSDWSSLCQPLEKSPSSMGGER